VSVSASRRACTCLLAASLSIGLASGKEAGFTIEWNPDYPSKQVAAVWAAYLMARAAYRWDHHLSIPASGRIAPTFDEEIYARDLAVTGYAELRKKDKNVNDGYWNDLLKVQGQKFVPQYVWTYLHQPSWPQKVKPASLDEFRKWSKQNLRNHKAETIGALSVTKG
jgi:hypothetical protein